MASDALVHVQPTDTQHGDKCYCNRPATFHVAYGTGCGHVCGIHRRVIERRKGRLAVAVPLGTSR